jgi:hypothetical protein
LTATLRAALRTPPSVAVGSTRLLTRAASGNVTYHASVPGMNKPPSRYEVIVRVGKDDGHPADPAAFAVAASKAASRRNAGVVSAHTAEEVICAVCVAAPDRPAAIAVALAVVADALRAGDPARSPSQ